MTVVLYGSSLALSSIGASLGAQEGLHVVPLDAAAPEPGWQPHALHADVVVFDLTCARPDALALWKTDPDLLVVGVDVQSNIAMVVSREFTRVWTTNDLVEIIFSHAPVHRSRH